MHGRRTRAVRIVAAGLAATVVGLSVPVPRLVAQKADPSQSPSSPVEKKADPSAPPPAEAEANPLPPAIPTTPPTAKETTAAALSLAYTPEGTLADPEGAAKAFVERSQKEADEAVAALSKEAEALRARLRKVEAGLARWQAVKESLGVTVSSRPAWRSRVIGGAVVPGPALVTDPGDDEPAILEPIPATPDPAKVRSRRPNPVDPLMPPDGRSPTIRPAGPTEARPPVEPAKPPEVPLPSSPRPEPSQPKGVVLAPATPAGRTVK